MLVSACCKFQKVHWLTSTIDVHVLKRAGVDADGVNTGIAALFITPQICASKFSTLKIPQSKISVTENNKSQVYKENKLEDLAVVAEWVYERLQIRVAESHRSQVRIPQ